MKSSLRVRLVVVLCASMCALWAIVAAWIFTSMRSELLGVLDDRLVLSTRMVAGIVQQLAPGQARAGSQGAGAQDLLSVVARDGIACEVSLVRGEVELLPLARTANSPGFGEILPPGFGQSTKGGKLWRTYVLTEDGIRITTADRIDRRQHLVRSLAYALVLPFLLVLVGIIALAWWSCKVGLEPLRSLQQALARRPPFDRSPIQAGRDVVELAPVVNSLNALLERMNASIEHERRWTADAAHELRTPLTAIKTHVQVAQLLAQRQQGSGGEIGQSLREAEQGISHMQGALEQLLQLARLENIEATESPHTGGSAIVDAFALACSQSLRRASDQGLHHRLETHLEPGDADAWAAVRLPLAAPLLTCAITNLLDNAMRHHRGTEPVQAALSLQGDGGAWRVTVGIRDQGPGMSAQECALALQRFWRKHPSSQGSGLGLTIVHRIADSAGGSLVLQPAPQGAGLAALLILPVCS